MGVRLSSSCDRCNKRETVFSVCHECSAHICDDCRASVIREEASHLPEIALCNACDLTPGLAAAIREEHGLRTCAEVA